MDKKRHGDRDGKVEESNMHRDDGAGEILDLNDEDGDPT